MSEKKGLEKQQIISSSHNDRMNLEGIDNEHEEIEIEIEEATTTNEEAMKKRSSYSAGISSSR